MFFENSGENLTLQKHTYLAFAKIIISLLFALFAYAKKMYEPHLQAFHFQLLVEKVNCYLGKLLLYCNNKINEYI